MTLSSLFIVCSHGRRSAHEPIANGLEVWQAGDWCPGGRPATLEDLRSLGGLWWICGDDYSMLEEENPTCQTHLPTDFPFPCGWRILIPLPQMVAE